MKIFQYLYTFTLLIALNLVANPAVAVQSNNHTSQAEKDFRYGKTLISKKKYKTATRYLKAAAQKGHVKAQYRLGILYYQQKQYKKARYWLRKRANAGNADAQYHYANTFRYALGTKEQTTIARRLYQKAANQGHVQAQFELAKMFQKGIGAKQNSALALKWYKKAAKKGNKHAKQALKIYKPAKQVAQKIKPIKKPKKIAQRPAKEPEKNTFNKSEELLANAFKGDPEQQYQLAMRYLQGYDIGVDINQAIYWLTQAADKHHPMAEYQLANQYFSGENTKQNIAKSVHYFNRAEQKGIIAAKTALTVISTYGFENLVKAELGEKEAQYEIAEAHFQGSAKLDNDTALKWLQASAKQSYPPALYKLGEIYEKGQILKKNYVKAFESYTKAAELNNPDAQYALSKMYKNGLGTEKNQTLANTWLNRAANQGVEAAQKALQFSEL